MDYEGWVEFEGMDIWDFVYCLLYFKKLEIIYGVVLYDKVRGYDGLIKLKCGLVINLLFKLFFNVGVEVGYYKIVDVNGYR